MAIAGMTFRTNPSLPTRAAPGEVVSCVWKVTANQPGKKLVLTFLDENGIEVEQYTTSLIGQLSPFNGSWGFVVPVGIESDVNWLLKGEFYADDPIMGDNPSMVSSSKIGVKPGVFSGRVQSNLRTYKTY